MFATRDLEQYAAECMKELDRLNIRYSKSISFVINTRAVTRLGLCKKLGSSYVIEISELLLDERTDLKRGLKTTVIHELLHTCRGCMKHTGKWAELAAKVNAAYGYNVTRVTHSDEGIIPEEMRKPPRYIIRCSKCGAEIFRQKRSPAVTNPEKYRCSGCGGQLIRVK